MIQGRIDPSLLECQQVCVVTDRQGRITTWGAAAERMFGWSREEAIGKCLAHLFPSNGEASALEDFARRVARGDAREESFRVTLVARRRNGDEFLAGITADVVRELADRIVYTVRDLSVEARLRDAQQERESQYGRIFETHPLPMWVFDRASRRILAVNEAAVRHYEYTRDEFLAMTIRDLHAPEDPVGLDGIGRDGRVPSSGLEAAGVRRHRKKGGTVIEVKVLWSSITFDDREAILILAEDITERQQSERGLRRHVELVQLLGEVAGAANQARSMDEALRFCLDRLCNAAGWPVGHALLLAPDDPEELISSRVWHIGDPEFEATLSEFKKASERTRFARGSGLPGRVLATGQPQWVENFRLEPGLSRLDEGRAAGLGSAFGFPVWIGSEVVGVLEFFAREPIGRDDRILEIMTQVGPHIGRVIERERAARELGARETRLRVMTERMPAVLWIADHRLRFTYATGAGLEPIDVPASWLLEHDLFELFQTRDPDFMPIAMHQRALAGESVSYEVDFKDHAFVVNLEPLRDAEGRVTSCIGVGLDITERRLVEQELGHSREQLRELARRLQSIREEEQRRIAREIHDELGQSLTALRLDLAWLASRLGSRRAELRERVEQMLHGTDEAIENLRRVAAELRPAVLEDLGLAAAIEWLVQRFAAQTGIPCQIEGDLADDSVDPERAVVAYRILQEALTNVARHAQARNVIVTARISRQTLMLEVQDDGRGISSAEISNSRSLGLVGMRERAIALGGTVSIIGAPGRGTIVRTVLPQAAREEAQP
jgi:PAS domain S-box-containing protein